MNKKISHFYSGDLEKVILNDIVTFVHMLEKYLANIAGARSEKKEYALLISLNSLIASTVL